MRFSLSIILGVCLLSCTNVDETSQSTNSRLHSDTVISDHSNGSDLVQDLSFKSTFESFQNFNQYDYVEVSPEINLYEFSDSSGGLLVNSKYKSKFQFENVREGTMADVYLWHYQDHHAIGSELVITSPSGKPVVVDWEDSYLLLSESKKISTKDPGEEPQINFKFVRLPLTEIGIYEVETTISDPGERDINVAIQRTF